MDHCCAGLCAVCVHNRTHRRCHTVCASCSQLVGRCSAQQGRSCQHHALDCHIPDYHVGALHPVLGSKKPHSSFRLLYIKVLCVSHCVALIGAQLLSPPTLWLYVHMNTGPIWQSFVAVLGAYCEIHPFRAVVKDLCQCALCGGFWYVFHDIGTDHHVITALGSTTVGFICGIVTCYLPVRGPVSGLATAIVQQGPAVMFDHQLLYVRYVFHEAVSPETFGHRVHPAMLFYVVVAFGHMLVVIYCLQRGQVYNNHCLNLMS